MRRPPLSALLLPVLALLPTALAGCHLFGRVERHRAVPAYFADPRDTARVRRVLLLPFVIEGEGDADPAVVTDIFCAELQKTGRFEVFVKPDDDSCQWCHDYPRRTGRFKVEALIELNKRYGADAVLFGTITRYRAYKPPSLGLSVKMISTHTGNSVWESEVVYDMKDRAAVEDMNHFMASVADTEESCHDYEMTMLSPRRFAGYVCHRVVERWRLVDASYR